MWWWHVMTTSVSHILSLYAHLLHSCRPILACHISLAYSCSLCQAPPGTLGRVPRTPTPTRWSRDIHNFAYPRSPDNDMGPCAPACPRITTVDPIPQSDHRSMDILGLIILDERRTARLLRASLSKFGEQWQCRDR